MQKKIIALFLIVFLCFSLTVALGESESDTSFTFRGYPWGESYKTVYNKEGEADFSGEVDTLQANYIAYATTLVGLDVFVAYYFCDDGLFEGRYILTEEHSNDDLYIEDYQTLQTALIKKYGEPLINSEKWSSDSKKDYYKNEKGTAVCYGYLTYETTFVTSGTLVTLTLDADNYDISTTLDYSSLTIFAPEKDFSGDL